MLCVSYHTDSLYLVVPLPGRQAPLSSSALSSSLISSAIKPFISRQPMNRRSASYVMNRDHDPHHLRHRHRHRRRHLLAVCTTAPDRHRRHHPIMKLINRRVSGRMGAGSAPGVCKQTLFDSQYIESHSPVFESCSTCLLYTSDAADE